jgi:hypothetical protein
MKFYWDFKEWTKGCLSKMFVSGSLKGYVEGEFCAGAICVMVEDSKTMVAAAGNTTLSGYRS